MPDSATEVGEGTRHQLREAAGALGQLHRDVTPHLLPTHRICQPSPCLFSARGVGQRFGAVARAALPQSITGYGCDRACYGTGCPHPRSLSELRVCTYFSNPRWHEQILPRLVQQIFGKKKAGLLPSLPPWPGAAGAALAHTGRRRWCSQKATGKPEIPADPQVEACRGFAWYTAAR